MTVQARLNKWSKRLYVRLFATIALVILVFQLLFTLFLNHYFSQHYEDQIRELGNATLINAGYQIQRALQRMEDTAYAIAYSDTAQRFLHMQKIQSEYYKLTTQKEIAALMKMIKLQVLQGVDYTLYAPQRKGGVSSTLGVTSINPIFDYTKEAWYQYMNAHPQTRRLLMPSQQLSGPGINSSGPLHLMVYRVNGLNTLNFNGYLVMQFDQSTFDELIFALPSSIQNVLIVEPGGETLYEHMSFLSRDALIDASEHRAGQIQSTDGTHYLPLSQHIPSLGWRIICTADASDGAERLSLLRKVAAAAMTFSLLLALLVIYGIARRTTRPMARLAAGMENIRLGQYDVQLPVERADEIGMLTGSFNSMAQKLTDANARLRRYEALQQSISFYALQQQIHPHFLYNTLGMIIGMATEGDTEHIIEVASSLSQMFRYCLGRELTAPLSSEVAHIEHYLTILKLRHTGAISMRLTVDVDSDAIYVPKLILQPFVENTIKHGFSGSPHGCELCIDIRQSAAGLICISMRDNGCGFPAYVLAELNAALSGAGRDVPSDHIGILNVYARLRLIYQDAFTMEAVNLERGGASVTMSFPADVPISLV